MKVLGGGIQVSMAEQNLDGPQVRSRLEPMGSPAMAQGVRGYMLGKARMAGSFFTGIPNGLVGNGSVLIASLTYAAGKEIESRLLPSPILTQRVQ
jgi:hypothetical protein